MAHSDMYPVERAEVRGWSFSELKSFWRLPMHETNYVECVGGGE